MITRYNYEEFFLLYIDNELSGEEKSMVEAFLMENADLKMEFVLLQQSIIKPESQVFFKHKESLFRQSEEEAPINTDNYESYFLQYTDNELDEAGKKEVEAFAVKHPSLLLELSYLLQTRQEPDESIVFTNKALLYKNEEHRKWVAMPWFRIGAAAVLLVLLGLFVRNYPWKQGTTRLGGKELAGLQDQPKHPFLEKNNQASKPASSGQNFQSSVTSLGQPSFHHTKESMQYSASIRQIHSGAVTIGGTKSHQVSPKNNDREGLKNALATNRGSRPAVLAGAEAFVKEGKINTPPSINNAVLPDIVETSKNIGENTANTNTPVNYGLQAISENSNLSNDQFFYIANTSSKKNKLRGIFRKVSRVFDKNTHSDDDHDKQDILIGGFQIALK